MWAGFILHLSETFAFFFFFQVFRAIKMPTGFSDMRGQLLLTAVGAFMNNTLSWGCGQPCPLFPFISLLEVHRELGCELQKCEEMLFQQEQK